MASSKNIPHLNPHLPGSFTPQALVVHENAEQLIASMDKAKFFKGLDLKRARLSIFQKMRIKNLRGGRVSEVRFKKTRLLYLGNVEKPPHPQFCPQRAPEG